MGDIPSVLRGPLLVGTAYRCSLSIRHARSLQLDEGYVQQIAKHVQRGDCNRRACCK